MQFNEKLLKLRKEKGYSQEELGQRIDVTRQTISNWELGISTPEMPKIIELAHLFGVSSDELLGLEERTTYVVRKKREYEYRSKKTVFGIPWIHIHFGDEIEVTKGIIAVGDVAVGVIAAGPIAVGFMAFGGLALGLFALGGLALGLVLAVAAAAVGVFSLGGVALGYLAVGGVAFGIYSIGGCAIAREIAYTGTGVAIGKVELDGTMSKDEISKTIERIVPETVGFIKNLFIALGKGGGL